MELGTRILFCIPCGWRRIQREDNAVNCSGIKIAAKYRTLRVATG
mgnify:CR=1 FL=1